MLPQPYATTVDKPPIEQVTPELPSPLLPAAVFLGIGLLLAIAVPVLMDRLDHSIRDARTATAAFAAPVLSSIPAARHVGLAEPGSEQDGAFRKLAATSIATDRLPSAIVVTSPTGEMQDGVAANFAAALAGLGMSVALVATDPRQAWYMGDTERPGDADAPPVPTLPQLLDLAHSGRLNGEVRASLMPTRVPNLMVVPPGSSNVEVPLDGLPPLLEALARSDIDVTVIAGPALLEDPNATILAWSTRSVLWVLETGEVTEAEAHEAASRLALAGATPFGVAMVDGKS